MPGKLKNRTRRALTFNLTTNVAPVRHVFQRRLERRDGGVSTAGRRLILPDSVTVLGRGVSQSLPDGVPHCPEVAAAIKRRDVEWIPDPRPEAEPKPGKRVEPEVPELEAPEPKPEPPSRKAKRG